MSTTSDGFMQVYQNDCCGGSCGMPEPELVRDGSVVSALEVDRLKEELAKVIGERDAYRDVALNRVGESAPYPNWPTWMPPPAAPGIWPPNQIWT